MISHCKGKSSTRSDKKPDTSVQCQICKGLGHDALTCPTGQRQSTEKPKPGLTCQICDQIGHTGKKCPKLQATPPSTDQSGIV